MRPRAGAAEPEAAVTEDLVAAAVAGDESAFADFADPDGNVWLLQEVDRSKG